MSKSMHDIDEKPGFQLPFRKHEQVNTPAPAPTPKTPGPQLKTSPTWQALRVVLGGALIVATLFTVWTPSSLLAENLQERMARALAASGKTSLTQIAAAGLPAGFPSNKIGIVVGHRGNDSGAVCPNGLTEVEVNSNIAAFVQKKLTKMGYEVELLDEFDARLAGYQAALLISIHADSCEYYNDNATGFKVAAALSSSKGDNATRLVSCLADRYQKETGLQYHYQSITNDMTSYHAFSEIDPLTTAAIIEVGFMNLDQDILTRKPEKLADGIVAGLRCYLNNEGVQATPTP
ncbi:MAG: N-acetylmuramoyl-L-alanine amidase [Anaerolineaceae bacterium]